MKPILIIGQGLAGTIVSYELLKRQIPHKVLDNNHKTAATKAAAGIINPITGRRYVKSWMIDELLPAAKQTYAELEQLLDLKLVSQANILRALEDLPQENRWHEATSRPGYDDYVEAEVDMGNYTELVTVRPSYGEIRGALQVAVPLLIGAYRKLLTEKEMLVTKEFDYSTFSPGSEYFEIEGEVFSQLIFCDGFRSTMNPLFKDLPFQPAKGESFQVELNAQLPAKLLRDKIFIAPQSDRTFWTGGGYEWESLSTSPTSTFKDKWTEKLEELLVVDYKINQHLAGIRPSVKGRRPLIGRHQSYSNIYLFNGLGTKGTSLAPYWAKEFVELLLKGKPISTEVDLNRFLT